MARLANLDHIHPVCGQLISPRILFFLGSAFLAGFLTAFSPYISMIYIMVVGQTNGRPVSKQVPVGPSKQIPFSQKIQVSLTIRGIILYSISTIPFINLISQKKYKIRLVLEAMTDNFVVWKSKITVTAHSQSRDGLFINGFRGDSTLEAILLFSWLPIIIIRGKSLC